ncbi:MAG: HEAT repeat domain-containing protein [Planctomycetota bacterium]|jgi:HEAT repeat protein
MKKPALAVLVLVAFTSVAWAICSLPPPVRIDPGVPGGRPGGPDTPPDDSPPSPDDPRAGIRPARARTGGGANYGSTWHLWWELNREHLLGLRQTLKGKDVVSGTTAGTDHFAKQRDKVRAALRPVAFGAGRESLRRVALCALGRAGNDEDAKQFLAILRTPKLAPGVYEGAAIGLGLIRKLDDAALREQVRAAFARLLAGRTTLSGRSRSLAIMALSLRGRSDPAIAWALAEHCKGKISSGNEAAALLYACALTKDASVVPVLVEATRSARLNKRRLHDVARSHAVLGLALTGDRVATHTIVKVLASRQTQIHTRRAAALALGMMLRRELDKDVRIEAERAMERTFDRTRDPLVKGYAAVGMGTARVPFGAAALTKTVEQRARSVEAPYAALALGLMATRLDKARADRVRGFLDRELIRAKSIELSAALSIAVGISGSKDAKEALFERLADKRLKASVRGPAIQGLGLLRVGDPNVEKTITLALDDGADEVVEDAAIALGLLGTRTTAKLLVAKLAATKSESVQVHMVAALSHLGGTAAIDPLIALLQDKAMKHTIRESAAAALGILVMEHDRDPMFEVDAHTNPFALTAATRELVLLY